MKKAFYLLVLVTAIFTLFFWLRQIQRPLLPDVPDIIIVGTSADFQPMSFRKDGQITGFDIDVVTEVVKRLGKQIEIKDMPFELLVPQLQLGTVHIVAAGMTPTPERAKRVLFTEPYLKENPLWVVTLAGKNNITSFKDLEDKEVIVNQGYLADMYMSKMPTINLIRLPTVADALLALKSGRGYAFVTASNTIKPLFDQYGRDAFNIFAIEETDENTALAIAPDYPVLAQKVQAVLKDMEADGTLQNLKEKWHLL
jgi:arginine/lysine/histidine transporter system substrate-binding protein